MHILHVKIAEHSTTTTVPSDKPHNPHVNKCPTCNELLIYFHLLFIIRHAMSICSSRPHQKPLIGGQRITNTSSFTKSSAIYFTTKFRIQQTPAVSAHVYLRPTRPQTPTARSPPKTHRLFSFIIFYVGKCGSTLDLTASLFTIHLFSFLSFINVVVSMFFMFSCLGTPHPANIQRNYSKSCQSNYLIRFKLWL